MLLKELEENLFEKLRVLRDRFGCHGIKSEFENEASEFQDLVLLRYLTAKLGLKLNIKIGGVEAYSDLKLALHLLADGIIIPMVESEFALIKSQNMIEDLLSDDIGDFKVVINIETKTALDNLDSILEAANKNIHGITIGRSDLSYSYGLKGEQDSMFINEKIMELLVTVSKYPQFFVTMGGGISKKTFENDFLIKNIVNRISFIETRNVILPSKILQNQNALIYALEFEKDYLNYKLQKNKIFLKHDENRFDTLNSRG